MIFKCSKELSNLTSGVLEISIKGATLEECMHGVMNRFPQLAVELFTQIEQSAITLVFLFNGDLPIDKHVAVADSDELCLELLPSGAGVWKKIKSAASNTVSSVSNAVSNTASAVSSTVSSASTTVVNIVKSATPAIKTTGSVISDLGNAFVNTVVAPVVNVAAPVVAPVVSVANNVGHVVGDVANNVGHVVGDISSNVGSAVNDFVHLPQTAMDTIKAYAEIPLVGAMMGVMLQDIASNKVLHIALEVLQYAAFVIACVPIPGFFAAGIALGIGVAFMQGLLSLSGAIGGALVANSIKGSRVDLSFTSTYTFEGAKNCTASGANIPVIYGTHRVGGSVLNVYTRSEVATESVLYTQIGLCEGEIAAISDVQINKLPASFYNSVEIFTDNLGKAVQSVLPNFNAIQNTYTIEKAISVGL